MSKWIRNYNPTEIDADEWGNILVLGVTGNQSVQQWQDYIDDGMQARGHAWMPLPESDIPKSVSVTIEVGDRTYTIENNGLTIEIHDSPRDPMGQPTVFRTADTITGILDAVDAILQEELHGNCECEEELDETDLTDAERDELVANCDRMSRLLSSMGVGIDWDLGDPLIDNFIRNHVNSLRGKTASKPASKQAASKPWKNKIGSYNVG